MNSSNWSNGLVLYPGLPCSTITEQDVIAVADELHMIHNAQLFVDISYSSIWDQYGIFFLQTLSQSDTKTLFYCTTRSGAALQWIV